MLATPPRTWNYPFNDGTTVQHLSRMKSHPAEPNLRQVHLFHAELFDELAQDGFQVGPGDLEENITTRGIDLLNLPEGTLLRIGPDAVVQVTGLRNPCRQINRFQPGLLKAAPATVREKSCVKPASWASCSAVDG